MLQAMPPRKVGGIAVAMVGIIAYSYMKLTAAKGAGSPHKSAAASVQQPLLTPAGSAGLSMLLDLPDLAKEQKSGLSPGSGLERTSSSDLLLRPGKDKDSLA